MEPYSTAKAFGGMVRRYKHQSRTCAAEMQFTIFEPSNATGATLYFLSGLTCTDENFLLKAGPAAFAAAAELGITIVLPTTSPPALGIKGEDDNDDISGKTWDFGTGAGFYLNATADAWKTNYNMYDYVVEELPKVVGELLPATVGKKRSVSGHSMGGHGALVAYLKSGGSFASCSAFAPICHPTACPWGEKAFKYYLQDGAGGEEWDATELLKKAAGAGAAGVRATPILIDQGVEDGFLEGQLHPHHFVAAAVGAKVPVTLRMQPGYDHSYFFVSTFVGEHVRFHAKYLQD